MAFRWEAIELERAARQGALEGTDFRLTGAPRLGASECPSVDEILEFCSGGAAGESSEALRAHLEACPACTELVTGALNDWDVSEPLDWLDVACNFRRGDRVAERFQIVRFISRGGMGEVYEAIDLLSSTRVALKAVLAACCDNRQMLRSFRREARLARKVRHPNVCRVHPTARAEAAACPLPFFTMEYIAGETLSERLSTAPLSTDDAIDVARQLLLGLGAIHRAGVLHLDLKSSNVMLRRGNPRAAIILDFRLARSAVGASRRSLLPLTGSLPYMPPEQMLGRSPGFRNDMFAFGVVLFQMLTGQLPFPVTQTCGKSSLVRRLSAEAPRPSQLAPRLPRWLDEVVLTCLADQDLRYPNVDAVRAALDAH